MNPLDLLTAQTHIAQTMHQADPDAPQVPTPGRPAAFTRRRLAATSRAIGLALLGVSHRLEPHECPAPARRWSAVG